MNNQIIFLKETDSTNTRITQLAKEGAKEGVTVWADMQTAGKGRRGRSWESPAGKNLYFSILLRPQIAPEKAPMLTLVMACAVARGVERVLDAALSKIDEHKTDKSKEVAQKSPQEAACGLVQIKWPNDLVMNQKKICGILTEMHLTGMEIDHVVIGTGINVNVENFPEELSEKATSLYLEVGKQMDRENLLQIILHEFDIRYQAFLKTQNLSFLQEEYNQKLINKGREVLVLEPENEYQGKALGINSEGELLVETEEGVKTVFAGEVSVRGIYGYV